MTIRRQKAICWLPIFRPKALLRGLLTSNPSWIRNYALRIRHDEWGILPPKTPRSSVQGAEPSREKTNFFLAVEQTVRPENEPETGGNSMTTCHIRVSVISQRLLFGTPFVGWMADDSIRNIQGTEIITNKKIKLWERLLEST